MKAVLLILLSAWSLSVSAAPEDLALCEQYVRANEALGCSDDNYLIKFGYYYCRRYVELEEKFEPFTQAVLAKIRSCLVEDLAYQLSTLTCETTEKRAMQSHLNCYLAAGFCDVRMKEKAKIFNVAKWEVGRLSFRKTMAAVTQQCYM